MKEFYITTKFSFVCMIHIKGTFSFDKTCYTKNINECNI